MKGFAFGAGLMLLYIALAGFHPELVEWWLGFAGCTLVSSAFSMAADEIRKMKNEMKEEK